MESRVPQGDPELVSWKQVPVDLCESGPIVVGPVPLGITGQIARQKLLEIDACRSVSTPGPPRLGCA